MSLNLSRSRIGAVLNHKPAVTINMREILNELELTDIMKIAFEEEESNLALFQGFHQSVTSD